MSRILLLSIGFVSLVACQEEEDGRSRAERCSPPAQPNTDWFFAYYACLDITDQPTNISGPYADIIVNISGDGQLVFSRETSYRPVWEHGDDTEAVPHLNLSTTLAHKHTISGIQVLAVIIRQHNNAIEQFDAWTARALPRLTRLYAEASRWVEALQVASMGFGLWETEAPRSHTHRTKFDGRVIAPCFVGQRR